MRKGDEGHSMYLTISGRLVAIVPDQYGKSIIVGEIGRGESVGEMALIDEGTERSADILAIRDTVVAEITREDFNNLVAEHPGFLLRITKIIIGRLRGRLSFQKRPNNYVVFSLIIADETPAVKNSYDQLIQEIARMGPTQVVHRETLESEDIVTTSAESKEQEDHRLTMHLNELETRHDYLCLISHAYEEDDFWPNFCLRHADYSIVIYDTTLGSGKRSSEKCLDNYNSELGSNINMMLVHPSDTYLPKGTQQWYNERPMHGHYHIRHDHRPDISRIARIICGKSNGLVLSGGGAKGMAHVGVYQALEEEDIKIDYVCGTSIGSIMSALIAMDMTSQEVSDMSEKVFLNNPTPLRDFNIFPFYGLLSGRKIDRLLQDIFGDTQIEDLWIPYFCVSSDLTSAEMRLHERGELWKSIRASISLPGVFPPVIYDGHVLVDGVVFNNIPVDIITKKGVGHVIGVNLSTDEIHEVNVEELPSTLRRWWDKISGQKKFENLPNMMETISKSTFAMSDNQSRDHFDKIDLFFSPPVTQFGLMDWKSFHEISKIGYRSAKVTLEAAEDLEKFRN